MTQNIFYLSEFYKYIDMKNQTNPIQQTSGLIEIRPAITGDSEVYYWLEQNELTLQDGILGVFESEPEPISFLSVHSVEWIEKGWEVYFEELV